MPVRGNLSQRLPAGCQQHPPRRCNEDLATAQGCERNSHLGGRLQRRPVRQASPVIGLPALLHEPAAAREALCITRKRKASIREERGCRCDEAAPSPGNCGARPRGHFTLAPLCSSSRRSAIAAAGGPVLPEPWLCEDGTKEGGVSSKTSSWDGAPRSAVFDLNRCLGCHKPCGHFTLAPLCSSS